MTSMRSIVLGVFLLLQIFVNAQQFGGHPPSTKWNQINTDTARIIFQRGLDSQAQRVASVIHHLAANNSTLGSTVRKIDIVLQNQTTIANGYVGLGPYRSEFFLTPAPNNFDLGTIPWADALALHEYRHVQQFNNFRKGISNLFYYLFGEEGYALASNAAIPDWFFEGDAVYTETVHSRQGRGRIPFFLNQYKALWLEGKDYSWMKLRNGSLKDLVPSHYHLGFLLVNYGYEKYGPDFWQKVTSEAAAYKSLFYPFQNAIKRHAGVTFEQFRKDAFDYYHQNAVANNGSNETAITQPNKKYVTNYMFPYQLGGDSLLYLRSTYRHVPSFYIRSNGTERKLRTKDIAFDEHFSYRNGRIAYAAYETDPRWSWIDYSVIRVVDIATNTQRSVGNKTKYFTPDISDNGDRVVAVNNQPGGKSELHVLNVSDGNILQRFTSSEIAVFTDPKFYNENTVITVVRLNDGRSALAWADINTGVIERLSPPTYNVIGFPSVANGRVYYTAAYFGNDELYSLDVSTKKIYRVSSEPMGRYFVNASSNKLVYSRYTADGYQLFERDLANIPQEEVNPMAIQEMSGIPVARASSFDNVQLSGTPDRIFAVSKYRKGTGLFNFHSWRPNYDAPLWSFSIYGQNVLNTLQTEIYYLYNEDEETSSVGIGADYGALFPVISVGTEFTFDRRGIANSLLRQWNQLDSRIGLSVPLNFNSGRSFKFLNFGSSYVLRNEFNFGPNKDLFREFNFTYLSHFISYNQQVQRAVQHILPRFGYHFTGQHRHAITELEGYQFAGTGGIYLPGILANHNLYITGGFQQRDTVRALFSTRVAGARGYEDYYRTIVGSRMWRLSANYHLPLLIPDWGFGNILYFQRIRSNLFYDMQRLYTNEKQQWGDLRSTGVEFYADTRWWNQYNLTFGLRVNYLLDRDILGRRDAKSTWIEFIVPVSIIPR